MLKLTLSPEPTWLEIDGGVRVKVPPMDTAMLRAVEYTAWNAYAALKTAATGGDDEAVTLDNMAVAKLEGAFALARVRALAAHIICWEGVTDDAGYALPLTPEVLDAFAAHPIAGPAFARAYDATVKPMIAEGNGSAPSAPGDGAAVIDTAPDAGPAAGEPAELAQPSSTRRKAGKA